MLRVKKLFMINFSLAEGTTCVSLDLASGYARGVRDVSWSRPFYTTGKVLLPLSLASKKTVSCHFESSGSRVKGQGYE